MCENNENAYFTPPHSVKPIDPAIRLGMEINADTIHVLFCGGFPTLSAYLCFRENVEVYYVRGVEELRETLNSANGIPPDLIVIYSDKMQGLPPLIFRSPVDGYESTVLFSLDVDITIEGELDRWYSLVDCLRPIKHDFVKGLSLYRKLHSQLKEDAGT